MTEVDVLINNMGSFLPGSVLDEEDGVYEQMMASNMSSAYYLTRVIGTKMRDSNRGHIFNICSTASIMAYTNGGSYCIAKHALLGFSRVLREELKEYRVKVTSVVPGATFTASWSSSGIDEERFMKPEDLAKSIFDSFQLSERSVVEEIIIRPQLGDI